MSTTLIPSAARLRNRATLGPINRIGQRLSAGAAPGSVLITGAGGGLGSALVDAFAAAGWRTLAGFHRPNFPAEPPTTGAARVVAVAVNWRAWAMRVARTLRTAPMRPGMETRWVGTAVVGAVWSMGGW